MADYDNTNRFSLFKNKAKEEGTKQPDYTGTLNADGVEFRLSAWLQTSKSGEKFFSGSIQIKEDKPKEVKRVSDDDLIPF